MTLDFLKLLKPRGSSVMGLTIEGRRLEGIVLSRGKDSLEVGRSFGSRALPGSVDKRTGVGRDRKSAIDSMKRESMRAVAPSAFP